MVSQIELRTGSEPRLAPIHILSAGLMPYAAALDVQNSLWKQRCLDQIGDTLILIQHPPVITLGMSGGAEDLHLSPDGLRQVGIDLCQTNRGGRATLHNPGQLVAYPIFKLDPPDLHAYLWKLEETVIQLLRRWQIRACREEKYPGVWVGKEKIAAVGIAVRDQVTQHGLALNVNNDLKQFNWITPCGIRERGVTSMQAQLGQEVSFARVEQDFPYIFAEVFNRTLE